MDDIDAVEITDEKTKERLERIKSFTPEEDSQILQILDNQMAQKYANKPIDDMEPDQFDMSKSQFREDSLLQKVDQEVIDMRHMLLLKFNIAFKWVIKFINVAERNN